MKIRAGSTRSKPPTPEVDREKALLSRLPLFARDAGRPQDPHRQVRPDLGAVRVRQRQDQIAADHVRVPAASTNSSRPVIPSSTGRPSPVKAGISPFTPISFSTLKKGDRTAQVARMYPVRWTVSVEPSVYVIFTSGLKVPADG